MQYIFCIFKFLLLFFTFFYETHINFDLHQLSCVRTQFFLSHLQRYEKKFNYQRVTPIKIAFLVLFLTYISFLDIIVIYTLFPLSFIFASFVKRTRYLADNHLYISFK
jgi:hypothetical protein